MTDWDLVRDRARDEARLEAIERSEARLSDDRIVRDALERGWGSPLPIEALAASAALDRLVAERDRYKKGIGWVIAAFREAPYSDYPCMNPCHAHALGRAIATVKNEALI